MKAVLTIIILKLLSFAANAQPDSINLENFPANSFAKNYHWSAPTLIYSYNDSGQTHNYSGNWDFDGDEKKDSLFFIGNGGAHLYYHLRIVLSSDKIKRDFSFLLFDLPYLGNIRDIKKTAREGSLLPQFVVHDFNSDGKEDIYLNFDNRFSSIPTGWKKRGLTSRYVLLTYKKDALILKNFYTKPN